jgi:hypothetical protein
MKEKKEKKSDVVRIKTVDVQQDGSRLRRIPTAAAETDVSSASIRKLLQLKRITRFKLNSMVYVSTDEINALKIVDTAAEVR